MGKKAIEYARNYLSYFPASFRERAREAEPKEAKTFEQSITDLIPENQNAAFNMYDLIKQIIDEDSFL
nr:carboxyl transferase domain-containing protein [Virgibacillus sp. NKC19-3]